MFKRLLILAAILSLASFGCFPSNNKELITAFVNVNLVPMTSDAVLQDQTVLVKGGRIEAVGPADEVRVPRKATIIDGKSAWLMPGLADMHMHTQYDWIGPAWPVNPLKLYLASGVTTVRCFGPLESAPEHVLKWRDEIREGKLPGPTIYSSGPILFGPVPDPEGAVRGQKAQGYDFVKIYSYVTEQEFREVMSAAKEEGIYTAGHIPFLVGLDGVLSEGMDDIAHIEELDFEFLDLKPDMAMSRFAIFRGLVGQAASKYSSDLDLGANMLEEKYGEAIREVVSKLISKDIPICTTLTVSEGIVNKLSDPKAFIARPEIKYMPDAYLKTFRLGQEKHQVLLKGYEALGPFKYNMEIILAKELKRAGITLLLGTDSGTGGMGIVPGFSIHDELRILSEVGFTPYEAIRTGTTNAAKVVGKMTEEGDFGTIEAGKRADLILVRGDPLRDVANIREPLGVMAAGRWYPEEKLKGMIAINK
ncbi:amidohydrolase family protein [bacterium]|nr:amidohydrolase family protein [bacterium]